MTTYLLITSDKPTEPTAFVGPKKIEKHYYEYTDPNGTYHFDETSYNEAKFEWSRKMETAKASRLPVVNPEEFSYYMKNAKLDTPVELEGWEPEIVYQYFTSRLFYRDANWTDCTKDQYESIKAIEGSSVRQAYRLVRSEPHTLSNAAKNIVDQSIVKVKSDEYNQFKADRMNESPIEAKTPNQDDFETEEQFFKACKEQREAKTQERSMEDLETPFLREIHRDLIVFLPLMTKGEMKPEFNLGYVSIVDGKRVEINMAIQVESHKTQESQTDHFKEHIEDTLFSTGRFKPEEASDLTQEILKFLTRRNP